MLFTFNIIYECQENTNFLYVIDEICKISFERGRNELNSIDKNMHVESVQLKGEGERRMVPRFSVQELP